MMTFQCVNRPRPVGMETRSRGMFRGWCQACLIGLLLQSCLTGGAMGQVAANADPYTVEAAFLRNFARYVTWPSHAFTGVHSPWRICILGNDPFGKLLEKTFQGRSEQGRAFEVYRAGTLAELPQCHIVFVAYPDPARRRAALDVLKKRPVLTVGDAPEFLRDGGIIGFRVSDRVEMSVNLDQARSASLQIQTKMLEVSREVVENGTVRRLR